MGIAGGAKVEDMGSRPCPALCVITILAKDPHTIHFSQQGAVGNSKERKTKSAGQTRTQLSQLQLQTSKPSSCQCRKTVYMHTSLLCVYNHCQRLQLVAKPSNFKGVVFSEGFRKQNSSLQSRVSTYCAKGNTKFMERLRCMEIIVDYGCKVNRLFNMFYTAQT